MRRQKQEILPTLSVNPETESETVVKFPEKGMQITILGVKDIQTTYGSKTVVSVSAGEEKYNVFLNATSQNQLIDKFGNDDADWIGKICNLKLEKDAKYKKKMIVFSPVA